MCGRLLLLLHTAINSSYINVIIFCSHTILSVLFCEIHLKQQQNAHMLPSVKSIHKCLVSKSIRQTEASLFVAQCSFGVFMLIHRAFILHVKAFTAKQVLQMVMLMLGRLTQTIAAVSWKPSGSLFQHLPSIYLFLLNLKMKLAFRALHKPPTAHEIHSETLRHRCEIKGDCRFCLFVFLSLTSWRWGFSTDSKMMMMMMTAIQKVICLPSDIKCYFILSNYYL